jgi:hypothetical protein
VVPEHFAGWANRHGLFEDMSLRVEGVRAWAPGRSCEGRARTDPTGRTRIAQNSRKTSGCTSRALTPTCGITFRQRLEDVGLPCRSRTMDKPNGLIPCCAVSFIMCPKRHRTQAVVASPSGQIRAMMGYAPPHPPPFTRTERVADAGHARHIVAGVAAPAASSLSLNAGDLFAGCPLFALPARFLGRWRRSGDRGTAKMKPNDAQRHHAEYNHVAALLLPWPGPQIPSGPT